MDIWVILLGAGQSRRLKKSINTKKQYLTFKNRPLFWHSAKPFLYNPNIKGIIFVFPKEDIEHLTQKIKDLVLKDHFLLPYRIVAGGIERQDSVFNGLMVLPDECTHVLIHDAARPFVTPKIINRVVSKLSSGSKAVIPATNIVDTIKWVSKEKVKTLPRKELRASQTPQGFSKDIIIKAHIFARENNISGTDDAYLIEVLGEKVDIVDGDIANIKITNKEDLKFIMDREIHFRNCVGFGYDVHRYKEEGKPLKLAGVHIPKGPKVVAHSDGDVLIHSLVDSILGCIAKGDIGDFFPDTDDRYKDLNSFIFLSEVMEVAKREGLKIEHVDITIVCEIPKISPYKQEMKKNLAHILGVTKDQINISATTEEGLGFTGEKKGIKVKTIVCGKIEIN